MLIHVSEHNLFISQSSTSSRSEKVQEHGGDWSSINFDDSLRDDGKNLGTGDFVEEVDDRFDAKGTCDGPVGAIGEAGLPCADVAAGFRDTSLRDKFSTGAS